MDGMPINTDATAAEATKYYGQIRHPTIDDIAVMVYDLWIAAKKLDPSLRWEDMRIWKLDLKGAYTLLSFRPEDVGCSRCFCVTIRYIFSSRAYSGGPILRPRSRS